MNRYTCIVYHVMFIGNSKILEYFDTAIKEGTLAHTYCFVGPDRAGKRTLARILAAKLLQVSEDSLGNNPDYYYLERVEDEKGRLHKDFIIDQVREIRKRSGGRSWLGGYQIAIIDEAELLNKSSGNALLKIFEEGGEKKIFFLLTQNDRQLLPTIRSRAQLFYFSLVPDHELRLGLIQFGYPIERVEQIVPLAWGRPGRARQLLDDMEFFSAEQKERARWLKLIGVPMYEKEKLLADVYGEKDEREDHIRARQRLDVMLERWTMLWREKMIATPSPGAGHIIDSISEARTLLRQNIHPRLVVENVVISF